MDIKPSFDYNKRSQTAEMLHNLEKSHKEDLDAITQALVKITSRRPEQIKPYLDMMLERLIESKESPFYETATSEEWSRALREWVDSHRELNLPHLSNEAISRESIYGERG